MLSRNCAGILYCFLIIVPNSLCEEVRVTDQVFFDMASEGVFIGRIIIGLFGDVAPKTVNNFKQIATNGIDGRTYEETKFHRVVERFAIQGGDIVNNDGTGSISIYGEYFDDENFKISHNAPGLVSMTNKGPNTNGCQFFITTMAVPWIDGRNTVFGKVIKGQDIIHKIEHVKTDTDYRPVKDIVIIRSGLLKTRTPFYENTVDYELTLWGWVKAGWFPLSFSFAILGFFHWIMMQLNSFKSFQ